MTSWKSAAFSAPRASSPRSWWSTPINHEVVTGPKIYLNAVAEDESEFDKVRHQIVEQLNDQMMQGTRDTYKLQQTMRRTLGSWVARQLHRKPMIVPVVADIAQDVETVETK